MVIFLSIKMVLNVHKLNVNITFINFNETNVLKEVLK